MNNEEKIVYELAEAEYPVKMLKSETNCSVEYKN